MPPIVVACIGLWLQTIFNSPPHLGISSSFLLLGRVLLTVRYQNRESAHWGWKWKWKFGCKFNGILRTYEIIFISASISFGSASLVSSIRSRSAPFIPCLTFPSISLSWLYRRTRSQIGRTGVASHFRHSVEALEGVRFQIRWLEIRSAQTDGRDAFNQALPAQTGTRPFDPQPFQDLTDPYTDTDNSTQRNPRTFMSKPQTWKSLFDYTTDSTIAGLTGFI